MSDQPSPKPCSICGKPATERYKPFCSQRCGTIDLARWITGTYRAPTDEAPEDAPQRGEEEQT
jgi:endogenous inhibitor of DNA gyrase (YacG/DUF329 family)